MQLPQGPNGQTVQINAPAGIPTGGLTTVQKVIGNTVTILLIATVILTLIYLIIGGIQWIQSGGDKQKVAQARSRLTFAIIGLVIAFCAFVIVNIVGAFFHVNLLSAGA